MSKPKFVLVADVHYNVKTETLADAGMRMSIDCAARLGVDLVIAGDLHDTKSHLNGAVVKTIIDTFLYARSKGVQTHTLVGNHDRLNEKSPAHALEFLRPYTHVIDKPEYSYDFCFIPYCATVAEFKAHLSFAPLGSKIIMHQGVRDTNSGHYIQDHSAVEISDLGGRRTISGHYHTRQSIGNHSFIGNPFTLTFAEANDPDKGFQILYDDGSLELVRTNLRKHVVIELQANALCASACRFYSVDPTDLVWVKVNGTRRELDDVTKTRIAQLLGISESFKLDLIPTDSEVGHMTPKVGQTDSELMDALIEASGESAEEQLQLKALYKEILC